MAISAEKLAKLRQGVCRDMNPGFTKSPINAALQAGKGWIEDNKASAGAAIEAAAPGVFSNAVKKKIFAHLFELQFQEDK